MCVMVWFAKQNEIFDMIDSKAREDLDKVADERQDYADEEEDAAAGEEDIDTYVVSTSICLENETALKRRWFCTQLDYVCTTHRYIDSCGFFPASRHGDPFTGAGSWGVLPRQAEQERRIQGNCRSSLSVAGRLERRGRSHRG